MEGEKPREIIFTFVHTLWTVNNVLGNTYPFIVLVDTSFTVHTVNMSSIPALVKGLLFYKTRNFLQAGQSQTWTIEKWIVMGWRSTLLEWVQLQGFIILRWSSTFLHNLKLWHIDAKCFESFLEFRFSSIFHHKQQIIV